MAIRGDLWSMDLSQVLQMLSLNQKEGQLVIDLENNRYLIPDLEALAPGERTGFQRHIYW